MAQDIEIATYDDYVTACLQACVFVGHFVGRYEGFQLEDLNVFPVTDKYHVTVCLRLQGALCIEGKPVYRDKSPVGLSVNEYGCNRNKFVAVKPYRMVIDAIFDDQYILYVDGDAICRSSSTGEWEEFQTGSIYFAKQLHAEEVHFDGGLLQLHADPFEGAEIICIDPKTSSVSSESTVKVAAKGFRRLGQVAAIYPAVRPSSDL